MLNFDNWLLELQLSITLQIQLSFGWMKGEEKSGEVEDWNCFAVRGGMSFVWINDLGLEKQGGTIKVIVN